LEVERFAERAASHVISPEDSLQGTIKSLRLPRNDWDIGDVRKLARSVGLTPLATATRLWDSQILSWQQYARWKSAWTAYTSKLKPRSGGFATPVDKTLGRAGRPFVRTVLEALSRNRIGPDVAARHLNLKYEHFGDLRGALIVQPGVGGLND